MGAVVKVILIMTADKPISAPLVFDVLWGRSTCAIKRHKLESSPFFNVLGRRESSVTKQRDIQMLVLDYMKQQQLLEVVHLTHSDGGTTEELQADVLRAVEVYKTKAIMIEMPESLNATKCQRACRIKLEQLNRQGTIFA